MLVRVEVGGDVRAGELFVPMHWNAQFASNGRVGALLGSTADPISGQPELKFAAVALRRFAPAWYGFVLSRSTLEFGRVDYRAAVKADGHWRYELAGASAPASWPDWSRAVCGDAFEWLEFSDGSAGRYRAAAIRDGRLQACLFVAPRPAIGGREWLAGLFGGPVDQAARLALLSGRPGRGFRERGAVVCSCFSVGRKTLIDAIRSQRLSSTAAIGAALQAGTNCGSCLPELDALLADELRPQALAATP
jgi:assimilatory nitrate reductase catalytic subunit